MSTEITPSSVVLAGILLAFSVVQYFIKSRGRKEEDESKMQNALIETTSITHRRLADLEGSAEKLRATNQEMREKLFSIALEKQQVEAENMSLRDQLQHAKYEINLLKKWIRDFGGDADKVKYDD